MTPPRMLKRSERGKGQPCYMLCGSGEPATHPIAGTDLRICTPCWARVETIETEAIASKTIGIAFPRPVRHLKRKGAA